MNKRSRKPKQRNRKSSKSKRRKRRTTSIKTQQNDLCSCKGSLQTEIKKATNRQTKSRLMQSKLRLTQTRSIQARS